MVMGERIKRTARQATARPNHHTGTTAPDAEATDAQRAAAAAADAPAAGDNAHRGTTPGDGGGDPLDGRTASGYVGPLRDSFTQPGLESTSEHP